MADEVELDVGVLRARRGVADPVEQVVPPPGRPDAGRLWAVVQRVDMSQVSVLCGRVVWRVCRSDAAALAAMARVAWVDGPGQPTLFGVPVEVVEDGPGRWPELVLVVDRRV